MFCLGYRPRQSFHVLVFSETCKVLGIQRIHTSSYHPESNGVAERWHRTLHTGPSHLVNHSHTDWDLQLSFFIMGYRATPHTTTGYSPFYLLHGREMSLRGNDNLKAKVVTNARNIDQRIESLKASLRSAFRSVKWAKEGRTRETRNITTVVRNTANLK